MQGEKIIFEVYKLLQCIFENMYTYSLTLLCFIYTTTDGTQVLQEHIYDMYLSSEQKIIDWQSQSVLRKRHNYPCVQKITLLSPRILIKHAELRELAHSLVAFIV